MNESDLGGNAGKDHYQSSAHLLIGSLPMNNYLRIDPMAGHLTKCTMSYLVEEAVVGPMQVRYHVRP